MPTKRTQRPVVESLDRRELLTTGVSAHLSQGVLSVSGTLASAPIVVDVLALPARHGVNVVVVVEGVGAYHASQVRKVEINEVAGESVVLHRGRSWNPSFHVNPPHVSKPTPTPTPTPPPVKTPTPTPTPTPSTKPPIVGSTSEAAAEQAIVDAVNVVRQQNGLAPLSLNAKLVQAAHIHANDMAALDLMEHDLPGAALPGLVDRLTYVQYNYATAGENIAFNYPDTASVMTAWMNSPGHRANILNTGYTEIGVGIAYDASGMPFYCQDFGRPA